MASFNWIFGKKKHPQPPQVDDSKEVEEDGYLLVGDNAPKESTATLYPIFNVETLDLKNETRRTEIQDGIQSEGVNLLSGVPFVIAMNEFSSNYIAEVQNFLYLTKRSPSAENFCYDFSLEMSIINQ